MTLRVCLRYFSYVPNRRFSALVSRREKLQTSLSSSISLRLANLFASVLPDNPSSHVLPSETGRGTRLYDRTCDYRTRRLPLPHQVDDGRDVVSLDAVSPPFRIGFRLLTSSLVRDSNVTADPLDLPLPTILPLLHVEFIDSSFVTWNPPPPRSPCCFPRKNRPYSVASIACLV